MFTVMIFDNAKCYINFPNTIMDLHTDIGLTHRPSFENLQSKLHSIIRMHTLFLVRMTVHCTALTLLTALWLTNSIADVSTNPTFNTLILRSGHYNAWKCSTCSFPVRIEMLRLMNKMSAKILNFWIGWINHYNYENATKFSINHDGIF